MASAQELEKSHILQTYSRAPLTLVRGEGSWVWDEAGNRYLDLMSGIAVHALGHCDPAVVAAIVDQASRLIHGSNVFYTEGQGRMASILAGKSGFDRVFFCNSGTEANEAAIKFARRFWHATGSPWRHEVATFENSFHGRTYGAMSATGQDRIQVGFGPMLPGFARVPFNDAAELARQVGAHTAAVMLEPLLAEGGVLEPTSEFLEALEALRQKFGFLVIADEIQTGLFRCGPFLAHSDIGLKPDIVTLAKPLGGGLPLGAVLVTDRIAEHVGVGDHGTTFGGNPVAIAAGLVVLDRVFQPGFREATDAVSEHLRSGLAALCSDKGPLLEVRGRGMLIGVRTGIDPARIIELSRDKGLLVYRAGSEVLRLLPPLNLSREDADHALEILGQVVREIAAA
jgi:predicted acetylornithine/succinylornithine family transaminase